MAAATLLTFTRATQLVHFVGWSKSPVGGQGGSVKHRAYTRRGVVDLKPDLHCIWQVGRLQTQRIILSGAAQPMVEIRLMSLPSLVELEQPFSGKRQHSAGVPNMSPLAMVM